MAYTTTVPLSIHSKLAGHSSKWRPIPRVSYSSFIYGQRPRSGDRNHANSLWSGYRKSIFIFWSANICCSDLQSFRKWCTVQFLGTFYSNVANTRLERMYVNNTYGVFLLSLTSPCFLRTPRGCIRKNICKKILARRVLNHKVSNK